MVKPQSSKLITRVRFPSSPRTNPSDVVGGIFCARGCRESLTHADLFPRALGIRTLQLVIPSTNPAQGCRESLPGENTFPRALGIFALQPVIPSRTSLRESLPHADLFPRALGIFALQLVIPSPRIHTKHPAKPREIGEYALSGNKPCTSRCVGHLAGKQVN